jgi:hypothetical protein
MEQQKKELEQFITTVTKDQILDYASNISNHYDENEFVDWLKKGIEQLSL